jgi:glycerate-2-kinase
VYLIGFGKAAVNMVKGVEESPLRGYIAEGIASVPEGSK